MAANTCVSHDRKCPVYSVSAPIPQISQLPSLKYFHQRSDCLRRSSASIELDSTQKQRGVSWELKLVHKLHFVAANT